MVSEIVLSHIVIWSFCFDKSSNKIITGNDERNSVEFNWIKAKKEIVQFWNLN